MTIRVLMLALVCVAPGALVIAQTEDTPPTPTPKEAPTTDRNASRPASASSPHQRQATGKEPHAQAIKDCVAKERAADSSVSKKDAEKTCKEQLKSSDEASKR